MEKIQVKYRTWHTGQPPRPTRLQIPGWSGKNRNHGNGGEPQPWHCPPFVEASTYGHELLYPYNSECVVKRINGELVFEGDFSGEQWMLNEDNRYQTGDERKKTTPPLMSFASGHYGMSSALDVEPPDGYVLRTEPHPRFYTDDTGTVPCLVAGHIQRWWSRIFFVVFKAPREGEMHVFRPGEPYGQVLFVPQRNLVEFEPFTDEERLERENRERKITTHGSKIAKHSWYDKNQLSFDDKYKVLAKAYSSGGYECVDETIEKRAAAPGPEIKTKIRKRLFSSKKK